MSTIANSSGFNTTTEPLPFNAEEVLRRTNESLSLAQRAANAGVWDWDLASDKVYVSPEYRDVYGMTPDTPLNYDFWLNNIVHPEDRKRVDEWS